MVWTRLRLNSKIADMKKNTKEFSFKEKSISIGLVAGVIIGAITENIGLWLPLGIAFGAAGAFIKKS